MTLDDETPSSFLILNGLSAVKPRTVVLGTGKGTED